MDVKDMFIYHFWKESPVSETSIHCKYKRERGKKVQCHFLADSKMNSFGELAMVYEELGHLGHEISDNNPEFEVVAIH